MNQEELSAVSAEQAAAAENQIAELQKITDYEIREWPIEVLVSKFIDGRDTDTSEIFIPDYQRELVWSAKQQSRFIESILIRLPVPSCNERLTASSPTPPLERNGRGVSLWLSAAKQLTAKMRWALQLQT